MSPTSKDKPISFNILVFKGHLTFKQFMITLAIIFGGAAIVSAVAFSSISMKGKNFNYDKDAMKIETDKVKIK